MTPDRHAPADPDRIRLLQFLAIFAIGGTERHFMNLTAGLDGGRFDLHVGCLQRLGEFLPEISARRMPVTEYRITRLYGLHTLIQQLRFAAYLRRNRIDIVCSYNFYANCFAVPAAWLARTPVVVASIRDTGAFLTPRQRRVQRLVCRLATVVLVNADAVRRWLIDEGYDPSKIVVIRNGIDLARFEGARTGGGAREELGVPRDAPVIAMLARVTRLKGAEYFIEAAAAVAARFPAARFLVVGDVPSSPAYRSELDDHIRRLGLEGRVVFTGFRLDVPELLAGVSVSVLPSLSEGLSNAVLESMAAAVPVVATRVGGMPEAIEDGVTGLLVPPRDSGALADAITRILADPQLAARLGTAGRRHIAEHFSLARMVGETDRLLSTLLAQTGSRRLAGGNPIPSSPRESGMLRRRVKTTGASLLHRIGADQLVGVLAGSRRVPLVLGYHRVVEDFEANAEISIPSMLVSCRMLEAQLDWIGRRYRFVSVEDLFTHAVSGTPFERPVAAVTFDDGYADVYENAFPILKRKGIPAALFLVTDVVGTSSARVYDKLYLLLVRSLRRSPSAHAALTRGLADLGVPLPAEGGHRVFSDPFTAMRFCFTTLPRAALVRVIEAFERQIPLEPSALQPLAPMTWDMVLEMRRAGFAIGSHTRRHVLLTNEAPDVAAEELGGSRRELERRLGVPVRHFAYPDGRFDSAVVSAVAAAGYQLAFTTCHHRDARHPMLTFPRKLLWENSSADAASRFSPPIMSCQVSGIFDLIGGCTEDHRGASSASPATRFESVPAGMGPTP